RIGPTRSHAYAALLNSVARRVGRASGWYTGYLSTSSMRDYRLDSGRPLHEHETSGVRLALCFRATDRHAAPIPQKPWGRTQRLSRRFLGCSCPDWLDFARYRSGPKDDD